MLNPSLSVEELAAEFGVRRRIQVLNALEPRVAEEVVQVLQRQTKWMLAFNRGAESVTLSQEQISALGSEGVGKILQECQRNAQSGFQYLYSSYPIVDAILNRRDVGHPLHGVLEAINAPSFRAFVERVTGVTGLVKADGQATLYSRGNFLTFHNDFDPRNKRRIAYVLGFTKRWRADWGGMLEFYDEQGNVDCGFLPRFNALSMFEVPVNHSVTYVAPFAPEGRYSITGWFSVA